jgi:hypothetical protein
MPETIPHVVTQEDLDNNPELVAQGVKVGDNIEIPAVNPQTGEDKGQGPGDPELRPELQAQDAPAEVSKDTGNLYTDGLIPHDQKI